MASCSLGRARKVSVGTHFHGQSHPSNPALPEGDAAHSHPGTPPLDFAHIGCSGRVLHAATQAEHLHTRADAILIITAAWTGCGWGEPAGLQRHNIHADDRTLVIDPNHGALKVTTGVPNSPNFLPPPTTQRTAVLAHPSHRSSAVDIRTVHLWLFEILAAVQPRGIPIAVLSHHAGRQPDQCAQEVTHQLISEILNGHNPVI